MEPALTPAVAVERQDLGDRECRLEAVQLALNVYGTVPDLLDQADVFSRYIMSGEYKPRTRTESSVVPFVPRPE